MPLVENGVDDTSYYLVSVVTGMRPGAGTHSNIFIIISGEGGKTPPRALFDGERKVSTSNAMQ